MEKPEIRNQKRINKARERREAASKIHATESHTKTKMNGGEETKMNLDEQNFAGENFPSNFTKGLLHNNSGIAVQGYPQFLNAINKENTNPDLAVDFSRISTVSPEKDFKSVNKNNNQPPDWRGWESPRAGHYFDLQGPDAGAFGMAPAPELGSAELSAEMAEVYAMALLRDVPFSDIEQNTVEDIKQNTGGDPETGITTQQVIAALNDIDYFSNPGNANTFAKRRLAARLLDPKDYDVETGDPNNPLPTRPFTGKNLFRGSGPGAKDGPWVSQFMLLGNKVDGYNHTNGFIAYGSQFIDQCSRVFRPGLDYMTNWNEWLDVQNGADKRGEHEFKSGTRRFLTTPRDMATYVRFDALYQAYLNACLILLGQLGQPNSNLGFQTGFPDQDKSARTGFASFGGPHILSLVTEVATRCLKFARRQKFNWHRRARPEKISGLLTLAALNGSEGAPTLKTDTYERADKMVKLLGDFTKLIHNHNQDRESKNANLRTFTAPQEPWLASKNLLLAMAFPEGSPMHPAYAAGHATVAGGCVTMLKAFFKTLDEKNKPLPWDITGLPIVEADKDGAVLKDVTDEWNKKLKLEGEKKLTLEGELNKLAANISIARNMAGVHYYSDYYDSLRMGERVAVGILVEQMYSYDESVDIVFRSFDGDVIEISSKEIKPKEISSKENSSENPNLVTINDAKDPQKSYRDWIQRPQTSVSGQS